MNTIGNMNVSVQPTFVEPDSAKVMYLKSYFTIINHSEEKRRVRIMDVRNKADTIVLIPNMMVVTGGYSHPVQIQIDVHSGL